MEKEFDSLSVKDIEALQEVPEALKLGLNTLIAVIKNKERFEVWLTRQGLHPNVVKRYVHLMFTLHVPLSASQFVSYLSAALTAWFYYYIMCYKIHSHDQKISILEIRSHDFFVIFSTPLVIVGTHG